MGKPSQHQLQNQHQSQWSSSESENQNWNDNASSNDNANCNTNANWNGNANLNLNGNLNANLNANYNENKVYVDVKVDANTHSAAFDMSHMFNGLDNSDGALLFMPENLNQSITGGDNSTNTAIHLDQVNTLVSNGSLENPSVTNNGDGFDHNHLSSEGGTGFGQEATAKIGSSPEGVGTGTSTIDAHATAQLDAFNQSIVMGANIQYNNFNTSVVGHDTIAATESHLGHT